jgi:hypothetical protein
MNNLRELSTDEIIKKFNKINTYPESENKKCLVADIFEELNQRKQKLQQDLFDLGVSPSLPLIKEKFLE